MMSEEKKKKRVGKDSFKKIKVIGIGYSSKVCLVQEKETKKYFAMKYIKRSVEYHVVKNQRDLLIEIRHPYAVSLEYAFKTNKNYYLVMEFVNGGELFHHLGRRRVFQESTVENLAAEIFLLIEFLQKRRILHRTIQTENILISKDGHVKVCGFGNARKIEENESLHEMVGAVEYIPPEILQENLGYGLPVDWYSYGILLYELLTGITPQYQENVQLMYHNILNEEVTFSTTDQTRLSSEFQDLCLKLLKKDPSKRLGTGGPHEVMNHPFFRNIDWPKVRNLMNTPTGFTDIVKTLQESTPDDTRYIDEAFVLIPLDKEGDGDEIDDYEEDEDENNKFYYSWPDELEKMKNAKQGVLDMLERIEFLIFSPEKVMFGESEGMVVTIHFRNSNLDESFSKLYFPSIFKKSSKLHYQ